MKVKSFLVFLFSIFIIMNGAVYASSVTPQEAKILVSKAVGLIEDIGDEALSQISDPNGGFYFKEKGLYVFVYDENCTMLAHPYKPELIGVSLKGKTDAKGKQFRDEIVSKALSSGKGIIQYHYKEPKTGEVLKKIAFCELAEKNTKKYIVVSGIYQE